MTANERKRKNIYKAPFIYYVYLKALRHALHSYTCKYIMPALMAPPLTQVGDIQLQLTTHISTPKDDRLSWPGWLIYSERFTHTSGHPSATG